MVSKTVLVGGLPIRPFSSMDEVEKFLFDNVSKIRPGFAIAVNAEKVILSMENVRVRSCLLKSDLLYADGILVVWEMERKTNSKLCRIPGVELWERVVKRAASRSLKLYLLGASEDVSVKTCRKLQDLYPSLKVVRRNGFFEDIDSIKQEILEFQPDVVTVAMGSPKQEFVIEELRAVYNEAFYMGVGGSYDVFAGVVKRAPSWMRAVHLEWLYRLLMQPKRISRQKKLVKYISLFLTNKL